MCGQNIKNCPPCDTAMRPFWPRETNADIVVRFAVVEKGAQGPRDESVDMSCQKRLIGTHEEAELDGPSQLVK